MSQGFEEIDWHKLGASRVVSYWNSLRSERREDRMLAQSSLIDLLTPFYPLNGMTSDDLLLAQMNSGLHLKLISFFIDALRDETFHDNRLFYIEILHDLACYRDAAIYVRESERGKFMAWANEVAEAVRTGRDTYRKLLFTQLEGMLQAARDLLAVLEP